MKYCKNLSEVPEDAKQHNLRGDGVLVVRRASKLRCDKVLRCLWQVLFALSQIVFFNFQRFLVVSRIHQHDFKRNLTLREKREIESSLDFSGSQRNENGGKDGLKGSWTCVCQW